MSKIQKVRVERAGRVRAVVKVEGTRASPSGRTFLPFTVRLYFYAGSEQVRMVIPLSMTAMNTEI